MSLASMLDNFVRRSFAARLVPYLKKTNPRLYTWGLKLRDVLLPVRSEFDLSRYQIRAIERFIALTRPDWSVSEILEIGSDDDAKVLREFDRLGARAVTGINPYLDIWHDIPSGKRELSPTCVLANSDVRKLPFKNESFTSVFSVAVLEHINDLATALSEIHRVLKPGGYVYAEFGPIWSCSVGHHVYAVVDGEEARHWKPEKNPVPNYAHLLLAPHQMRPLLQERVSEKLLSAILEWIYEKPSINRLFFEDYDRLFKESEFEILALNTVDEHVSSTMLKKLCDKHPGYKKFSVRNVEVLLKKT